MKFGRSFFTHREQRSSELGRGLLQAGSHMSFKCGVIGVDEELRFKKTVFRITKGNSVVSCVPFCDLFPHLLPAEEKKVAFFILFPGNVGSYFDRKLSRLIENFSEGVYELPNNEAEFEPFILGL
jgi:V-type H+-transporting ATPase subunit a